MECFVLPLKAKLNQPLMLKVGEQGIPHVRVSFPKADVADYERGVPGCGLLDLSTMVTATRKETLKEVILN